MHVERIRRAAHNLVDVICDELAESRQASQPQNRAADWLRAGGSGTIWPALLERLAAADSGAEISLRELAESEGVSLRGVTGAVGRAISRLGGYQSVPLVFSGEGEAERVALTDESLRDGLRASLNHTS